MRNVSPRANKSYRRTAPLAFSFTGTARYCSINTHKGYEQSRRDDIESIGYVLIYFLKGCLPWQGLKCRVDEDHYEKIFEKKKTVPISDLCSDLPGKNSISIFKFIFLYYNFTFRTIL